MENSRKRRRLADKVEQLGPIEHGEIFETLRRNDVPFTQNANGVFVNLAVVGEELLDDVLSFVDHCLTNKEMLRETRVCQIVTHETASDDAQSEEPVPEVQTIRVRTDPPPLRKSNARFHNLRKKFARPQTSKQPFSNELRREAV